MKKKRLPLPSVEELKLRAQFADDDSRRLRARSKVLRSEAQLLQDEARSLLKMKPSEKGGKK